MTEKKLTLEELSKRGKVAKPFSERLNRVSSTELNILLYKMYKALEKGDEGSRKVLLESLRKHFKKNKPTI